MTLNNSIGIGIDPGSNSGCICIIDSLVDEIKFVRLSKATDKDLFDTALEYRGISRHGNVKIVLERVGAMPGQGVSGMFKFGQSFGKCEMFATIVQAPFHLMTPRKWQKAVGCYPIKKEPQPAHKKRLRQIAERLYPQIKMTNYKVDALLMAHLAKQI